MRAKCEAHQAGNAARAGAAETDSTKQTRGRPALRLAEVAGRGEEDFARDGGREQRRGERRDGRGEDRHGHIGTAGEEDDGAGVVVRGVGRAVEQAVQLRARGENGEREHERGAAGREEAAEKNGGSGAVRGGHFTEDGSGSETREAAERCDYAGGVKGRGVRESFLFTNGGAGEA